MSKKEKFYYLYKTTNLINGKYYYGMHCTSNLEDGYLGSGKLLGYSIKKYGIENFKKEILSFHKDRQELIQAEKDLITLEVINESQCLNLIPGGTGGWHFCEKYRKSFTSETAKVSGTKGGSSFKNRLENDKAFYERHVLLNIARGKEKYGNGLLKNFTTQGLKHKEESKKLMSTLGSGEKNSQAGTYWIYNDIENKKIKKHELENYLLEGWTKGRKMKF